MSVIQCPNCQNYLEKPEVQLYECPFCGYSFENQGDSWEESEEIGGSEGSTNIHALTLNFNGGTYNGNAALILYFEEGTDEVYFLDDINIVPVHSSENLVFKGWSDSPNGEVLENADALSYSTVYAIYEECIRIDFLLDWEAEEPYKVAYVKEGSNYTIDIENPTRDGYNFLYWEDDAYGNHYSYGDVIENINFDIILFAYWEEVKNEATSNVFIKINGKQCVGTSYVKINGTYKVGIKNYVKVNDSWKTMEVQPSYTTESNDYGTTVAINKYTTENNDYGTTVIID